MMGYKPSSPIIQQGKYFNAKLFALWLIHQQIALLLYFIVKPGNFTAHNLKLI
jgi:hypothetical protein